MMFYDKIDDALESIGLDYLESDQDRRDAEEARKNSRHIDEAMNAREVKRANDSHRKPAPGTPAWILSNVRKGKAGCRRERNGAGVAKRVVESGSEGEILFLDRFRIWGPAQNLPAICIHIH